MSDAGAVRKLERRSSGELVADHLRREIFAGRLAPGQKINQEEVATQLGVSRIPVREALVILENEGRVTMEHQRGAFVVGMDAQSVRDNGEIFGMIYGLVARRAAERRTDELDARLAAIAEGMAAAGSPAEVWRQAEAYLDAVMEVGAAPRLARVLRRMRTLAVDNLFDVVPTSVEVTRSGTLDLIDAVRAGDGERAAEVQAAMQAQSTDLVIEAFEAQGILADER